MAFRFHLVAFLVLALRWVYHCCTTHSIHIRNDLSKSAAEMNLHLSLQLDWI